MNLKGKNAIFIRNNIQTSKNEANDIYLILAYYSE